jgi:ABC-type branched-subunit amino acid transport system ATPase component/SAM-dependent methyltransferase
MLRRLKLDPHLTRANGLEEIEFDRLGDIVALAGPNGAGKTRILKSVCWQIQQTRARVFQMLKRIDHRKLTVELNESIAYDWLTGRRPPELPQSGPLLDVVAEYSESLARVSLTPSHDPARVTPTAVLWSHGTPSGSEKNLSALDTGIMRQVAFAKFFNLHKWAEDNAEAVHRAERFSSYVQRVLQSDFGCEGPSPVDQMGRPLFDQRPLSVEELSNGQIKALQWISNVEYNLAETRRTIILIDEPELYLHPAALITLFEILRELKPAQIWVATHSIPLLAYIGHDKTYFVEKGRVEWAGNKIARVQAGLLGGEEGVSRLRSFLNEGSHLAFHHFATQCLLPPASLDLAESDRQASDFVSYVQGRLGSGKVTRLLDYAAGRGRLAHALAEVQSDQKDLLRYHAYNDPRYVTSEEREACRGHVQRLASEGDLDKHYAEKISPYNYDDHSRMDAVVLCNVLHEIPPDRWISVMKEIRGCLRDNGVLVIMEDQQMPVGELPHEKGYLVLEKDELGALFGIPSNELDHLRSYSRETRLTIFEIPARYLDRCTEVTRQTALGRVRDRAMRALKNLRSAPSEPGALHRRGREHAYYAMLHANAVLALE